MRDIKLTDNQYDLIKWIDDRPMTTRSLAEANKMGLSISAVHRCMRRLEDRDYVRRVYRSNGLIYWELTHDGREKLASE